MLMSVVKDQSRNGHYPELTGARVMITGLAPGHGVDIARAFADHNCRLLLQTPKASPELDGVLEVLAKTARDIVVTTDEIANSDVAMRFAQRAVTSYGGLDVAINIARLNASDFIAHATSAEVEDKVAAVLSGPTSITRVLANRMRLTWTEGLILNIVTQGPVKTTAEAALGSLVRAALAAITREEAKNWASQAVRVNAVAPGDGQGTGSIRDGMSSEPEIAALALHLASKRGRALSGLVFDATGVRGE